jgi:Do/DeqQ family serine protease
MLQNFSNLFIHKLLLLVFMALSIAFAGGCRVSQTTTEQPGTSETITPQQQPIVLADGIRTSYADIVERVSPAVVNISSLKRVTKTKQDSEGEWPDFFQQMPREPQGPQRGVGSGVIINSNGTILTNHHVIEGATDIEVELPDKRTFKAKLLGSDEPSDLAVLKVEAENLPALPLGDSDKVRVGDVVLAIGNPLGIGQTVTSGIISAKGRRTGIAGSGDASFEDFLQTDAPINRGNSGGALVNLNGELIGINSQILSTTGGSIGIGFSIPSNMAKGVMEQLIANGKVRRGLLGADIRDIDSSFASSLNLKDTKGAIVVNVREGSAAEKAGLKRYDVITAINGDPVDGGNMLRNRIAATAPGTEVTLTVSRDGKEQTMKATLDERNLEKTGDNKSSTRPDSENPGGGESGKLGLTLQPLTPAIARQLRLDEDASGLVVTDVDANGPAADAGITRGDVIMEANRQPVTSVDDLQSILEKSGERPLLLLVNRRGQTTFLTIQPQK